MRKLLVLSLCAAAAAACAAKGRVIADDADFARLREHARTNALARAAAEKVLADADQMRRFQTPMRALEGRRMLAVSQRALARIVTLATAFKLNGDPRHAARAVEEAVAVSAFKDWNPQHFLDTAEMTLAAAVAYDWLADEMTPAQRATVRDAILKKGLCERDGTTLRDGAWARAETHWGPVCHAGLIAGAAAVMDDAPEVAQKIFLRAARELPRALAAFEPSGAYAEGPAHHWAYAMTFTAVAVETLARAAGTDFGLAGTPGLRAAADYPDALTGPTGLVFNHSDAGILADRQQQTARRAPAAGSWWLARRFGRADALARFELPLFRAWCADRVPLNPTPRRSPLRLLPLALLWMPADAETAAAPDLPHGRLLDGRVGVSAQRSGTDARAWFVALKGGSPSAPHGHMDAGSFVLDAKGCRWAADLGSEDYFRMEDAERGVWDRRQDGGRWRVFRLGVDSHNTLTIDAARQYAAGTARFVSVTTGELSRAELDLTPLYPAADRVTRAGSLVPGGGYLLNDELSGLAPGAAVRWQMTTPARVKRTDGPVLVLAQTAPDGEEETLTLTVSDTRARWSERSIEERQGEDESVNPGMSQVWFTLRAGADGRCGFTVRFE